MNKQIKGAGITLGILLVAGASFAVKESKPFVSAKSPVEAGRYLVAVTGCNDCHTAGWLMAPGKIPEGEWLKGSDIGWKGPWGTSYARNLRSSVARYTESEWIKLIKSGTLRPPMPAENLAMAMSDEDFKAIYAYIKSLPPENKEMPEDLLPGMEPKGPYIDMMPKNLPMPPGGMPSGH